MGDLSVAVLTFGFFCFAVGILLLVVPKQRGSVFEKVVTNMVQAGGACLMLGIGGLVAYTILGIGGEVVAAGLGKGSWVVVAALIGVGMFLLFEATYPIWRGVARTRQRSNGLPPTSQP